jgi:acyl transferase domain-containing protein
VVTECEAFDTTCRVAINNFGFGGVNAHVVLENGGVTFQRSNSKKHFAYGRTEGNVKNELTLSPTDFFLQHRDDIIKYPYRGVASSDSPAVVQKVSDISARPIVFVYSGQGSQHKEMAKNLLESNDTFRETIYRLSTFLDGVSNSSIDLVSLFETGSMWENKSFSSIGITAVQLGLTNMLAQHGVKPDVVIGHSMGEIACAYADKCMSEAQCIHVAYIRSQLVALLDPDTNIFIFNYPIRESSLDASFYVLINQYNGQYTYRVRKQYSNEFESNHGDYVRKFDNQGAMLFVSMVEDVANEVITALSCQSTVIACYNSLDGLTLSGSKPEIMKIANYCVENSVFHRSVETGNIAYHSPLLSPYELYLVEQVLFTNKIIIIITANNFGPLPFRLKMLFRPAQQRRDRASGYRLRREIITFAMPRITLAT